MALFLSGIATPVNAQTSEEWAAYNPRVARVRAELKELQKTGPIRNWNLKDAIRIWSREGYRDIPDADLDTFEREIARERMLRQRIHGKQSKTSRQQQADQNRADQLGGSASGFGHGNLPEMPQPPRWGDSAPEYIYPSRIFAGPTQYPPASFAAYGVVAFPSRAAPEDIERYHMICEAYVTTLPHSGEVRHSLDKQMVTVWPINSDADAVRLNARPLNDSCKDAVQHYGLLTSLKAIKDARLSNATINGRGPFLLAWSPATQKAQVGSLVLISNLSDVTMIALAVATSVCRALEGDGADRNLPTLEARPFRGVGGQFLDRHVERNIGQHQHVQRVVDGAPEAAADDLL
jgi:hypothetical protein